MEGTIHGSAKLKSEAGSCFLRKMPDKVRKEEKYFSGTSFGKTGLPDSRWGREKEDGETDCTKLDHTVTFYRKLFWLCISLCLLYNSMPAYHIGKSYFPNYPCWLCITMLFSQHELTENKLLLQRNWCVSTGWEDLTVRGAAQPLAQNQLSVSREHACHFQLQDFLMSVSLEEKH